MIVDVKLILHKKRRQDNDFIFRVQQCFQHDIQAACRTAGHEHLIPGKSDALFDGKLGGNRITDKWIAAVWHIGMHPWSFIGCQACKCFLKLGRRRQVRITKTEVENIFSTKLRLEPGSFFKHLSDPGRTLGKTIHFLRNGHGQPPLYFSYIVILQIFVSGIRKPHLTLSFFPRPPF